MPREWQSGEERNGGKHGGGGWERGGDVRGWRTLGWLVPGIHIPTPAPPRGALSGRHLGELPSDGLAGVSPHKVAEKRGQAEEGVCWLCFLLIRRYDFSVICIFGTK